MRTGGILLTISLITLLTGCLKHCGPAGEPRLQLVISSTTPLAINDVRPLGALASAPVISVPKASSIGQGRSYVQLDLPVNLNADQTQYILTSATRSDTVTVNYRRVFSYEDVDCGYIVNLFPRQNRDGSPSSTARIVQTTTGTVESVSFEQTLVYQIAAFYGSGRDTGISVTLKWP
ncbi:MAG: hypothetical protein EOO39_06600 [Cytophagaceae bacterium]|nr:MAG: hypothetical protein EOO39_06600 [Cytophagaceae bacterium]